MVTTETLPDHRFHETQQFQVRNHMDSMTVGTCYNCRVLKPTKQNRKHTELRYHRHRFQDQPTLCPQCGFALFYERIPKSGSEHLKFDRRAESGYKPKQRNNLE